MSWEQFRQTVLPRMLASAQGVGLRPGYVPQTSYFLWDGEAIVGLFRLRHYLNDALRGGAAARATSATSSARSTGAGATPPAGWR